MHLSMSSPRGGPRAYVGHLTSIDHYHVPDILDLKRGWTGINNAYAIFRMHNLFCVHCLCPSRIVSNSKWRLRELIEFLDSLSNKLYATQFSSCFNVKYNHVLKGDWHPATIISSSVEKYIDFGQLQKSNISKIKLHSCFLLLMKRQQPRNVWYFTHFPRKNVYLLVSLYLTIQPVWVRGQTKTNKACKYAIVFF